MRSAIQSIVSGVLFTLLSLAANGSESSIRPAVPTFEENIGQFNESIRFAVRTNERAMFLTATELLVSSPGRQVETVSLTTNPRALVTGVDRAAATSHYLRGRDPSAWKSNVPHFHGVKYQDAQPGRDLVLTISEGKLAYAYLDRARGLADQGRPEVGDPDSRLRGYMTYLGGLGTDIGNGIAVDVEGNAYVIGRTESDNFPTVNPTQPVRRAGRDIFVTKLSEDGSEIIYSTYIGGSGDDNPLEIAVDPAGNAYITGVTSSVDFPTAGALQPTYGGGLQDGFVLKLLASGSALAYSTYLGGTGLNQPRSIVIDASGSAYVTGNSPDDGFPTKNPIQTYGGGVSDAFVAKLTPEGDSLVYSTFIGGSALESGRGIRVDRYGSVYVAGETRSLNFPATANAFQKIYGGGLNDMFAIKIDPSGSSFQYATYLGGSGSDQGQGLIGTSSTIHGRIIAVDSSGSAYITGDTASSDFPVRNALQPAFGGGSQDAFAAKLTPDGSDLVYSTYFGGSGADTARSISVDRAGRAVFAGGTSSLDFPVTRALQPAHGGGDYDGFMVCLNVGGDKALYATYFGGKGTDVVWDVVAGSSGQQVYITGQSSSPDLPQHEALKPELAGGFDAFVGKLVTAGGIKRYDEQTQNSILVTFPKEDGR